MEIQDNTAIIKNHERIDRSLIIAALILVLASVFLLLNDALLYKLLNFERVQTKIVAQVTNLHEDVRQKNSSEFIWMPLKNSKDIYNYDNIFTGEHSDVEITFTDKSRISLAENTLIFISVDSSGRVLNIMEGSATLHLQAGEKAKVIINNRTQEITGTGEPIRVGPEVVPVETVASIPAPTIATPKVAKATSAPITLTDGQIAKAIKKQKPALDRCYTSLLRSNPDLRGRITASMVINPNGKVGSASIKQSTISDDRLQLCALSVLKGIHFDTFSGKPIVINYPINFE